MTKRERKQIEIITKVYGKYTSKRDARKKMIYAQFIASLLGIAAIYAGDFILFIIFSIIAILSNFYKNW